MTHVRKLFIACLVCLAAALSLAAAGVAAQEPAPQQPFGTLIEDWTQDLELASRELVKPDLSDERAEKLRDRLAAIRAGAMGLQANTRLRLEPLARTPGIFGLFKGECKSKVAGTIESISSGRNTSRTVAADFR